MTISLSGLVPEVRERAELAMSWAKAYQLDVTVTSAYRSWAEQTRLYQQYRDCLARGENISPSNPDSRCHFPANAPGDSAHNYGLAWDSWVPAHQQWAWDYLRQYAGFALYPNDVVHAEVPNWRLYAGTSVAPIRRG